MAKKKIHFSKHAEEQIKERNLSKILISEALLKPAQIIEGKKGRKVAQKICYIKSKKYLLRIIFNEQKNSIEVITAYLTTKIEKYWRKENAY